MKTIFDPAHRAEILRRIDSLTTDSKAAWGKMTVAQMVRHCSLCEAYYQGMSPVNRSFIGRLIGRHALKSILKEETAGLRKNAPTARQFIVSAPPDDLEAEKIRWKELIENYSTYNQEVFVHWFFGSMTREQLGRFIYKHCDHHLTQFLA